MRVGAPMGYVLSILMNALRTWLLTKLWDSFYKTF